MSEIIIPLFGQSTPEPEVINEAYFESWTNDQLVYRAWTGCDLAQDILFDEESCEDSRNDARFEVLMAQYALRVLVRRFVGMPADRVRELLTAKILERASQQESPQ